MFLSYSPSDEDGSVVMVHAVFVMVRLVLPLAEFFQSHRSIGRY